MKIIKIKRFDEFKIYDGKVFYFDEVISSADPKSFIALDSNYGKDNKMYITVIVHLN